jgi:hypothetical protein
MLCLLSTDDAKGEPLLTRHTLSSLLFCCFTAATLQAIKPDPRTPPVHKVCPDPLKIKMDQPEGGGTEEVGGPSDAVAYGIQHSAQLFE